MATPNVITTGHSETGVSSFISSPPWKQITPRAGVIYSTSSGGPLDLNNNADIAAFAAADHSALIPKEGSAVLVATIEPGQDSRDRIHRTLTVDVCVMLKGQGNSYTLLRL